MTDQGAENYELPKMLYSKEHKHRPGLREYTPNDTVEKATSLLWIFSSWTIIFLNIILTSLSIRDMYTNGYSPTIHWFASAVFVATIGGIVSINTYIIRK